MRRDEHIKTVQKRLEDELIDIPTFLSQITFADNVGVINNIDTFEDGDEIDDEIEEEENVNIDVNEAISEASLEGGASVGVDMVYEGKTFALFA